jgi:hypothetical protein
LGLKDPAASCGDLDYDRMYTPVSSLQCARCGIQDRENPAAACAAIRGLHPDNLPFVSS